MKVVYIAAIDYSKKEYFGVYKKIEGQIKAFNELNFDIDSILIKDSKIIINNNVIDRKLSKPWYSGFHKLLLKEYKGLLLKYEFVYIRFSRNDINFLRLLRYLSANNIKVIVEIPTYPYDKEFDYNFKQSIYRIVDKYVTKNMYKYTYRIATTNSLDKIYNIDTIQIRNGVDTDSINITSSIKNNDVINFVGIANLSKWHGYDRMINGLSNYYKDKRINKEIHFYVIGEGVEKENLIRLTNRLCLNNYVHFLGAKIGKELDRIVDDMHIGVSSLALFRAGGGHDPIKTKEFLAQGLPVIVGYNDKLVDMALPYVIKVDECDEAIDFNYIIERFNNIEYKNLEIRDYAEKMLSWRLQMSKVVNLIR